MKKFWEGIKEKVIVGLILSIITTGGIFLYNTGKDLWELPSTVKELKRLHTSDSVKAIKYIIKLDSICKVVKDHEIWLEDDYKNIQVLKEKKVRGSTSSTNKTSPAKTTPTNLPSLRQTIKTKTK